MMESPRGLRVIVALAITLCIVASLTGAHGEDKNPGGLRVATVDINRMQNEYKVIKNFKQELDKKQEALRIQMQTMQQNPLLPEVDQKTLADLNIKDKSANGGLSPAEKTNQSKLVEHSRKLMDDYNRLQGTPIGAATDADKKLLQDYVRLAQDTETRANAAQSTLQNEMQTKLTDTAAQTQKSVHDALKVISKEKGYNLVLSSEIAPYAEYDCTDDVIKLLNK
jgi:Skp family chaperone for outer membrane proteins